LYKGIGAARGKERDQNASINQSITMSKPIAFIIGAGKNIGASTTKALQAKGYRVARGNIAGQDDPSLAL